MDALECIHLRRSIRIFDPSPIRDEHLDVILRAAMTAPSAGNQQPWHFVVIRKREALNHIAEIHPYAGMARTCGLAVLLCAEPALEKHPGYFPQDLSAATQNMLLAVTELGLGAVWCGVHPVPERIDAMKKAFNLPDGIEPFSLVCIGHTHVTPKKIDRFKPERIHQETW